jgi:glycosyltransferase involved in cell wall biosynthesis
LVKRKTPGHHRLAIIIPVIPDVSHTFIYRELARIKKYFDCSLYAGIEGDKEFETPLTRSLTLGTTYLPALGSGASFARYYLSYLAYLISSPVKVANLVRLYEREVGGHLMKFVDHRSVLNRYHPVHGFYFARLLEGERVGHIHAYCTHFPTTFTLVAAHMLEVGFSVHSFVDFDFFTPFKMLEEKLRLCDFDVVPTDFCKERLLGHTSERYREKIHVIRFGLDLRQFVPRNPSGAPGLRLLCIGNLVPKKAHHVLIKACEILKKRGLDFELLIIGTGPLRQRLEELTSLLNLNDRITFTGGIPNDKIIDYLTPDAILVVPSMYVPGGERDGMPTVIAEAMAMGTPVIATHAAGIPEVVTDHYNGLLVWPEDYDGLAGAIEELASDAEMKKRFAENGLETIRRLYDESRSVPQLVALFARSLGGDGSGGGLSVDEATQRRTSL